MGASPGPTRVSRFSRARSLVTRSGGAMSRTMARPSVIPAAPPRACTSRAASSHSSVGAHSATTLADRYSPRPTSKAGRRPQVSDTGPYTSWPSASPITYSVMVCCMLAAGACKALPATGSAGTKMCMAMVPLSVTSTSSHSGAVSTGSAPAGRATAGAASAAEATAAAGATGTTGLTGGDAGGDGGDDGAVAPSWPGHALAAPGNGTGKEDRSAASGAAVSSGEW